MFQSILDFLSTNVTSAFAFIGDLLTGGVSLIYGGEPAGLTDLGQLVLLTALIGLGLWGLNFVISMLPFTRMGKR
ncbi:MAG: hypothetical protein QXI16_01235 [Sulfolobaceae archaeon]